MGRAPRGSGKVETTTSLLLEETSDQEKEFLESSAVGTKFQGARTQEWLQILNENVLPTKEKHQSDQNKP